MRSYIGMFYLLKLSFVPFNKLVAVAVAVAVAVVLSIDGAVLTVMSCRTVVRFKS